MVNLAKFIASMLSHGGAREGGGWVETVAVWGPPPVARNIVTVTQRYLVEGSRKYQLCILISLLHGGEELQLRTGSGNKSKT